MTHTWLPFALLSATLTLSGCFKDETLTGYGAGGVTWELTEMDGSKFPATATLRFPEKGRISGKAPCNAFNGTQSAPYPWFKAENIASTKRACPDLVLENRFFTALGAMTLAEISGDTFVLSNDAGREMVFRAKPPAAE